MLIDERRVGEMVDAILTDPSAKARPFDFMNSTFEAASEEEFRAAFDRVVLLLRELLELERIDASVSPKAEPTPTRRRLWAPPEPPATAPKLPSVTTQE
jgi:hypothetical protein